jgi:twitching motility protein PilT
VSSHGVLDRKKVEEILRVGIQQGASDVHFKTGERVLMRVKGRLHRLNLPPLSPESTTQVYEALRPPHLESLPAEKLREVDFSLSVAGAGRFRVNVFRQRGSVALVIRLIPMKIPSLDELNLPERLPALASERRGLILVTGATGSGKSTTLAAMINHLNQTRSAHVVTIEDPIEFLYLNNKASIVQREVGNDTESFAVALRAALRQDPDVIMVGEMRDTETIDIALKAAETGHLVLSTAHTTDAAKTIQRIMAVFPSSEQGMVRVRLAETLRAVISQRLLPRADEAGLIPAVELMVVTRVIQDAMRNPDKSYTIEEYIAKGRNYGMRTFDQALLELLRRGLVTREVALSAASSPGDLDLQLRMGIEHEELAIEGNAWSDDIEVPYQVGVPVTAAPLPEEPVPDSEDEEKPLPAARLRPPRVASAGDTLPEV